jgi:enoyl-CoA hydratase
MARTMVETQRDGRVMTVRLSHPPHNFMTGRMVAELADLVDDLRDDASVGAVIVTGGVEGSFVTHFDVAEILAGSEAVGPAPGRAVAGGALRAAGAIARIPGAKDALGRTPAAGLVELRRIHDLFVAIGRSDKVWLAAINGLAMGGGCELALACDLVLASDRASFAMPESAIGLVPGFGVLRGPAVMGRHWTKWMVLAGERVDAAQAERIGLVQRVVPHDTLLDEAVALGERIARAAPLAVRVGKQMINRGVDRGETGYSLEAVTMLQETADTAEGIAAFTEKRPPRFEGR